MRNSLSRSRWWVRERREILHFPRQLMLMAKLVDPNSILTDNGRPLSPTDIGTHKHLFPRHSWTFYMQLLFEICVSSMFGMYSNSSHLASNDNWWQYKCSTLCKTAVKLQLTIITNDFRYDDRRINSANTRSFCWKFLLLSLSGSIIANK